MVRLETDIPLVNSIANRAEVRPFIRPDGMEIDFGPLEGKRITETGVILLSNGEDAVGVFEMTADGIYQAHTMFAATCRGRRAIDTAREMIDWLFARNANIVWGATPRANRPACMFNRLVGAKVIGGDDADVIFEYKRVH